MHSSIESIPVSAPSAEKKSVEDLLTFEISRGDSRQQRLGWTPWALYAALSTLIWLLISEIEKSSVNLLQAAALWGIFVYGYYAAKALGSFLNSEHAELPGASRFTFFNRSMASQRSLVLAVIVKQTVVLGIFWNLFPLLKLQDMIFVGGFFILDWLITVGAFVMSWLELPIATRWRRRGWGDLLVMGIVVLGATWSWFYVVTSYSQLFDFNSHSFGTLRVAFLLFAAVEVLEYILASTASQPMLPLLVSIRRELALGNITPQSARSHLDVALLGMQVGDMMNSTVREFIALMEKSEQKVGEVSTQLEKIIPIIEMQADQITDADVELFQTRSKLIQMTAGEIRVYLAEVKKIVDRFKRRIDFLRAINPDCVSDIEALKIEMRRSVDRLQTALNGSSNRLSEISVDKLHPRLDVGIILNIRATLPTLKG